MNKKDEWKKSIRAEVAAALQGATSQTEAGQKRATQTNTSSATQVPPPVTTQTTVPAKDLSLVRRDLLRIGIVTGCLAILLAGVTIADRQTNFLRILYDKVSRSVDQLLVDESPSPTTDDTSPVPDLPTE